MAQTDFWCFNKDVDPSKPVQFVDCFPNVPSETTMVMLEAMTYKVTLLTNDIKLDPSTVLVQVWTNMCESNHPGDTWHYIDLSFIETEHDSQNGTVRHTYGYSVVITGLRDFEFTFRFKSSEHEQFIWACNFGTNGLVHVQCPCLNDRWTTGPDFTHIINQVYIGNYITASSASKFGFTHVLNVADNLDMVYKPEEHITYHKIPMRDGANNIIPCAKLCEAVQWLKDNDHEGNKVLVNCRAGIGRAGSTVIAYVFAINQEFSFEDAFHFVSEKRFVYPHDALLDQCYELFRN